jgi:hypothetical protein
MYVRFLQNYTQVKDQVLNAPQLKEDSRNKFSVLEKKLKTTEEVNSRSATLLKHTGSSAAQELQVDKAKIPAHTPNSKQQTDFGSDSLDVLFRDLRGRYQTSFESGDFSFLDEPSLTPPQSNRIEPEEPTEHPLLTPPSSLPLPPPVPIGSEHVKTRSATTQDIRSFVTGLVDDAAKRFELDTDLGLAIVETESSFNIDAMSSDGHFSKGLFQLLDSTGKEVLKKSDLSRSYDPFDPQLNVELGMRHLRRLIDIFATDTKLTNAISTHAVSNEKAREKFAVAAYNAGEGRVAWAQERAKKKGANPSDFAQVREFLPSSTRSYVEKVISSKEKGRISTAAG